MQYPSDCANSETERFLWRRILFASSILRRERSFPVDIPISVANALSRVARETPSADASISVDGGFAMLSWYIFFARPVSPLGVLLHEN